MSWLIALLTFPIWSAPLMLIWYAIGVQVERDGLWKLLAPVTFGGFLFDVFLQYTVANLWFWEINPKSEYTISLRIARLMTDRGWRGVVARWLARLLNRLAPSGRHIEGA